MRGLGLRKGPYLYKFLNEDSRCELQMSIKARINRQKEKCTQILKINKLKIQAVTEANKVLREDPQSYTSPCINLNNKLLAEFDVCKKNP